MCTHVCLVTPGYPCDNPNKVFNTVKFRDCLFAVMKKHYLSISERLGTHLITLSLTQYLASKIHVNTTQDHYFHMSVGAVISKFHTIAKTLVGAPFEESTLQRPTHVGQSEELVCLSLPWSQDSRSQRRQPCC